LRRGAVWAAGVVAALAIAAPVAEASAAKPRAIPFPVMSVLPAFIQPTIAHILSSVSPGTPVAVAAAGPGIDDIFNGGTTVVVSTSSAVGSVNGSP
jgi:hypothetical protein